MTVPSSRSHAASAASARTDAFLPLSASTSSPAMVEAVALALPTAHKCLVPVETPLSRDGELSARNAQHRSNDHFEAVVQDTTWLLTHALGGGHPSDGIGFHLSGGDEGSPSSHAHTSLSRTHGSENAGDVYASAKTRRLVSAQAQRAFAFFRLQQFAHAVKDYDACLAREPTSALLYYNRGCAFYAWNKKARAVHDFTRALKLDCKNALFVESRAAVSKELGRFYEAIQDYTWLETLRRVTQHSHGHHHTTSGMGGADIRHDNVVSAIETDTSALTTMSQSFSMNFSELQASLMGATIGDSESSSSRPTCSISLHGVPAVATDCLTTEEREAHVREWMVRFLQRSPWSRSRGDVRDAVQHAQSWSFFRGMDAAMVEQCLEDAQCAYYASDDCIVQQGERATHFHIVLAPTAPFVKNIDAPSGVSKVRELKKLSQGDAVGTDAFAVSFGDGTLRTVRCEMEAAAAVARARATDSLRHASIAPDRHSSIHAVLDSPSLLAMLASSTSSTNPGDADTDAAGSLLPPEPASFTSLEPVHCLLLQVDTYRDILHDHEARVLDERTAFLCGCRVFQSCAADVLTALAAVSAVRVYDPGKDLLRTGDEVAQLCVIQRGVCQVRKTLRVPAHPAATAIKKKAKSKSRLSPLRLRQGGGEEEKEADDPALASSRSSGDGSWVLDNGWMLTNPRLVNTTHGDGKEVPMVVQDVGVGTLASGQVFGELSVLQPGQPSQVTIHSQTFVELLVFAQSDLARLQVQYHSGTMNALQESLLFHNPPQQKIVQLQRDRARWEKQKRGVLGELALQLPNKAQSVLRGAACMKPRTTLQGVSPLRRRASLVAVPPLSPPTRHHGTKGQGLRASDCLSGVSR